MELPAQVQLESSLPSIKLLIFPLNNVLYEGACYDRQNIIDLK